MCEQFDQLKAEMEADLYEALEALESDDMVTVRRCSARSQTNAVHAFRLKRDEDAAGN